MGQFCHHHSGKTRTMALFWLRTSYHAQRYMFQRYMLRSLLMQSFNIVNTPIVLLFSKKRVPGFAAEDNSRVTSIFVSHRTFLYLYSPWVNDCHIPSIEVLVCFIKHSSILITGLYT